MFISVFDRGFTGSHTADDVQWRHQGTSGNDSAGPPPGDGKCEGVGRFWRPRLTPSPHERGECILRNVFGRPWTSSAGERIPDQPGRERPGDLVEFHTTNEPGRGDQ